jgi:glycosyltransferase involved in cell wall biosynthesis
MVQKYRVVQHVAGFNQIGGPSAVLRRVLRSSLAEKYDFAVVSQDYPAGGINVRLLREMAAKIRCFRPDLVHVRGLQNEGFHGILAAYLAGCRNVLVSVHGFAEDSHSRYPWRPWIVSRLLEPLTLLLARHVYCVCAFAMDRPVIRRYARGKCSVIHNGIEIVPPMQRDNRLRAQLGATPDDVVGLYVGRIVRDKGLAVLANALRQTPFPNVLWLAGNGADYHSLYSEFGELVESGRVRFLGRRDDVPALLGACDFFVFPTLHENLSSALLEAMLAKRAVLATDVGGNSELVINGVTGLLVPPNDVLALAGGLEYLSQHLELCATMGEQGRDRVEKHFSMSQMVEKMHNLYSMLLA